MESAENLTNASLIKNKTDDGLFETFEDVEIGKKYKIDLSSKRRVELYNLIKDKYHYKDIVDIYEQLGLMGWTNCGYIAIELLKIGDDE